MHPVAILQLLVLLSVANGAPVVAKKLFGNAATWPLDAGAMFFDGRPLFGRSKTIRGILLAVVLTTLAAPLLGLELWIGAIVGVMAMAGDLFSSFMKRRLDRPSSSRATGLDQIPEALFPMLACRFALALTWADIVVGVAIFFAGEIFLSRVFYRLGLREEPY
jgi:hypothetical protein